MARPLRIEFEGAWYHVMNRGSGRRWIFKSDDHKRYFLSLLKAVKQRFNAEIHAYCLMDNHYHLMIRTPEANLQRIMRHLNGVYTQYFNRSDNRDGPLFRGRYKAIIVDAQTYWLELSRYIHRNPLTARLVDSLETYAWSSYPAYIGEVPAPTWLSTQYVLRAIGQRNLQKRYRAFVEAGISEELAHFYGGKKQSSILGDRNFQQQCVTAVSSNSEISELKTFYEKPSVETIIARVAKAYSLKPADILISHRGRAVTHPARGISMYLCQEVGHMKLADIAVHFGLAGYASAGACIRQVRQKIIAGDVGVELDLIIQDLTP